MSSAPEGSDRQTRAAYARWAGQGFPHIARCYGYDSAEEAEVDYELFMKAWLEAPGRRLPESP